MVVVEAGHDPPGGRVVLQIVEHTVHLVHVALGVVVLHAELVAMDLPMEPVPSAQASQMRFPRSWMLLDFFCQIREELVHAALEGHSADGLDRELGAQVVTVHNSSALPCRLSPSAPGSDGQIGIPGPVGEDIFTVLNKQFIRAAHRRSSVFDKACIEVSYHIFVPHNRLQGPFHAKLLSTVKRRRRDGLYRYRARRALYLRSLLCVIFILMAVQTLLPYREMLSLPRSLPFILLTA